MQEEHIRSPGAQADEARAVHERLALPLLVPAAIFLFAVLVIYGLSRIYLELNEIEVGDVTMATPLAIGVALGILAVSAYLASRPTVPRWQVASIVVAAALLLTGGAIWAAVHEEEEAAAPAAAVTEAAPSDGGVAALGAVGVALTEFKVAPVEASASAGTVTFTVTNDGTVQHNLRVIKTDLEPDALPVDDEAFMVDEDQVEVVASSSNLDTGASEVVSADLAAGSYVLICNIPTHYESGMVTACTVE